MNKTYEEVVTRVQEALIKASTTFSDDKRNAYEKAVEKSENAQEKWVLETILKNAEVAEKDQSPLCDDTGIPHMVLELGDEAVLQGWMLHAIQDGIKEGLRKLPGRPMGALGNDIQRIEQSAGLDPDSGGVEPAPMLIRHCRGHQIKLYIMMFGGGPAIRGKSYRIFHQHDRKVVSGEIIKWAIEGVSSLGCSPCTLAIGIGRSHFEAASMMLLAQIEGRYAVQSELEKEITDGVNQSKIGPLGLHGNTSVLATFLKIGPQRASGVRIVCIRPCCCFEPRISRVELFL